MPILSWDSASLFLAVIVPGTVVMMVFGLLIPAAQRDAGRSIVDIITYGFFNMALMSPVFLVMNDGRLARTRPYLYLLAVFIVAFISPAVLAIVIYLLRTRNTFIRWFNNPIPTAWDYVFRQREEKLIVFHMKSGNMIGGYYGESSYVSTYPYEPEVYVERACRVSSDGRIEEWVLESSGLIVPVSECQFIELFSVRRKDNVQ